MKKRRRLISILLAAMLLAPSFTSCAESTDSADTETTETTTAVTESADAAETAEEETAEAEEESAYLADQLPDSLDFNGADSTIFCWDSWDKHEFFVEEDTGEIVDSAVFARNLTVEDRLNVKLVWDMHARDGAAYGSDLHDAVTQQNSSGDNTYDIVACYAQRVANLAASAQLMNLNEGEYINLENPWYYKTATEAGTFHNGYTYLTAGDLSYNALARMSGVFFNQDMITDYNLEDPYTLVLEGKWTIDKMHEMITGVYKDTDADGKQSDADTYGVMVASDQIMTIYYGTGSHFIDHDENGTPIISDDILSDKTISTLEKYVSLFTEESAYKLPQCDVWTIFDTGRCMFYIYPLGHISDSELRDADFTYGFIPQPKVAEDETDYHASVTNAVTVWAIPLVIESNERSSAVMECLASEGYRQVTPVVFEQAYKLKYNYDESSSQSQIFDMMRENIVFDMGKIFGSGTFGDIVNGVIGSNIWDGDTSFASKAERNKKLWNKNLEKLIEKLTFDDSES